MDLEQHFQHLFYSFETNFTNHSSICDFMYDPLNCQRVELISQALYSFAADVSIEDLIFSLEVQSIPKKHCNQRNQKLLALECDILCSRDLINEQASSRR